MALEAETVAALRRHGETQALERDFAGAAYDDADLVFADELGGAIPPYSLTDAFARNRKLAGIPSGNLHTLRHTAITLMLLAGAPLHVVAARVGDRPETVLATYAHLLPHSDAMAADAMATVLAGG